MKQLVFKIEQGFESLAEILRKNQRGNEVEEQRFNEKELIKIYSSAVRAIKAQEEKGV